MAANTQELIADALYLSGIVARENEVPSASEIGDGLKQLNSLLSQKQTQMSLNPYYQIYNFNAIVGKEDYFIPNLIDIETITYTISTLRYSMVKLGRDRYFGSARVNNIESLPTWYFCEQKLGGATIYMYPLPNIAYPFEVHAKFRLSNVTQFQDLTNFFDENYRDFLMVSLAKRLLIYQGFPIPQTVIDLQKEVESNIRNLMAPKDCTVKIRSPFRAGGIGIPNPAASALYSGWWP